MEKAGKLRGELHVVCRPTLKMIIKGILQNKGHLYVCCPADADDDFIVEHTEATYAYQIYFILQFSLV